MSENTRRLDLYWRASKTRVPVSIYRPFVDQVVAWSESSGQEWTVSRVKSIKVDFLRWKAGQGLCSAWVSRRGSTFKGIIGRLQEYASRSEKTYRQSIQLLMIYSYYISPSVTAKQMSKEIPAITGRNDHSVTYPKGIASLLKWRLKACPPVPSWTSFPASKRTPFNWGYEWRRQEWAVVPFFRTTVGRRMREEFYEVETAALDYEVVTGLKRLPQTPDAQDVFRAGNILLNQESGFKLRLAASPNLLLQLATHPLKTVLYSLIRETSPSAVFNQDYGRYRVAKWIDSGEMVHSFDLSSATHRFPLDLQVEFLKDLKAPDSQIRLFSQISRLPWLMPDGEEIKWEAGQPLGLMPSYGVFHLTHLLMALSRGISEDDITILGDDVAIRGDQAAQIYLDLCTDLNVSISAEKTLSSDRLAEFAGSIIGRGRSVFSSYKWRGVSDANFVDQYRSLGNYDGASRRHRDVLDIIGEWPSWAGGLELNPRGKPLVDRLPPAWFMQQMNLPRVYPVGRPSDSVMERIDQGQYSPSDWRSMKDAVDQTAIDLSTKYWGLFKGFSPLPVPELPPFLGFGSDHTVNQLESWSSRLRLNGR